MYFNPLAGKAEIQNAEEILKKFELFISGGLRYIAKSFCKNMLKIATPCLKL
jgi:hypothetical protein